MYVSPHFNSPDAEAPWRVIAAHGFGVLVTAGSSEAPLASPLPFLACPEKGMLIGHIARANEQFERLQSAPESDVLVMFQGPSAFVSAAYYDDALAIPTWDHVTVHVTGPIGFIEDEAATLDVLAQTVAHFESLAGSTWRLDVNRADLPDMVRQVTAFTVSARRIQSIFKLSQNVDPRQRELVATGLRRDGHDAVARGVETAGRVLGAT